MDSMLPHGTIITPFYKTSIGEIKTVGRSQLFCQKITKPFPAPLHSCVAPLGILNMFKTTKRANILC